MSPPRADGVIGEAEPHPAMILWPSFKQMAEEAVPRRLTEEHDTCSSSSASDDDDFEFAPIPRDSDGAFAGDGVLLFPVFDRDSFLREDEKQKLTPGHEPERPGTEEDGRDGGPDYCLWRPKPRSEPETEPPALEATGKCRSTGGVPARSHPSGTRAELAAAVRSRSDGAGRFGFMASPSRAAAAPAGDRLRKGKKKVTETDMATAHRLFYSKQDGGGAAGGGGGHQARRSYLPYRRDLVGFFAGGTRFLPF